MRFVGSVVALSLLVGAALPAWAQNRTVQGTVRDSLGGAPVSGAEVVMRGSGIRGVTNE